MSQDKSLSIRMVLGSNSERNVAAIQSIPQSWKNTTSSTAPPNCMRASSGIRFSIRAICIEITPKNGISSVVATRPSTIPTRISIAWSLISWATSPAPSEGASGGMNPAKPANDAR
ncbi:hypothetical protein BOO86_15505 [Mycobacterium sp. CBMA 234]|nr:hypothetical protein [Mycolicibacterium sp. CBMA 234]